MRRSATRQIPKSSRGAILVYLVVVLVVTGILAATMVSLSMSATESDLVSGPTARANHLAKSAAEYAQWQYCQLGEVWNGTMTLNFADGEVATVDLVNGQFEAVAVAYAGTRLESRSEARAPVPVCDIPPVVIEGENPGDYVVYIGGTAASYALPSGSSVDGSIFGPQVTILPSASEITGNIVSLSSVDLGSGTTVGGYICAESDVLLRSSGTTVAGDVIANGNVTLESATSILGNVHATGNVLLKATNSVIAGDVHAGGNVTLESGTRVLGNVYAGGFLLMLSSDARIEGNAHAGTGFEGRKGRIFGDLYTGWNALLIDATRIDGNVYAKNDVIFGSGAAKVIVGTSQAGGSRNDHMPANVFMSVPNPTAPNPPSGCPPEPPPPQKQVFTPSANNITVPQGGSMTIPPGTYGTLTLGGNTVTTLQAGGTYIFQSFGPASWSQTLRLNLSTGDRITVFVSGPIAFSGRVEVSTDGVNYTRVRFMDTEEAKLLAKRVYWETHGSYTITTNNSIREWFGTVLSDGNVSLASGFYVVGAVATINGSVTSSSPQHVIFSIADFAVENWNPTP